MSTGVITGARRALIGMMLLCLAYPALAQAGKHAWTSAGISQGLHSLNQAVTVSHSSGAPVPETAVITQVYANRDYAGRADIQTSLCWGGPQRCVDIVGRSINTRAFEGLSAGQPMLLVHRARGWQGSRPPVYIKSNVTVWYETPALHAKTGAQTGPAPQASPNTPLEQTISPFPARSEP